MKSIANILVVEHVEQDVDDALKLVSKFGCEPTVLRNGRKAWNFFAKATADTILPDLVLLGLHLPECDGLKILRQMRANERTKDIPVIILTSSALERHVLDNFNLGLHGYLVKPVTYAKLLYALPSVGLTVNHSVIFQGAQSLRQPARSCLALR